MVKLGFVCAWGDPNALQGGPRSKEKEGRDLPGKPPTRKTSACEGTPAWLSHLGEAASLGRGSERAVDSVLGVVRRMLWPQDLLPLLPTPDEGTFVCITRCPDRHSQGITSLRWDIFATVWGSHQV